MKQLLAILMVILSLGMLCSCGETDTKEKGKNAKSQKASNSSTDKNSVDENEDDEKGDGKDNDKKEETKVDTVKVIFKYHNGQKEEEYTVKKGELAPKPKTIAPTKEKCNFVAWGIRESDGKTLKTKWNFDTDKVETDTVIHANYTLKSDFYLPEADAAQLKGGANARIMSFNVLAAEWANCSNKSVNSRVKYFKATIERYLPDVIGVQEFNAEWYAAIKGNGIKYKAVNASSPKMGDQYNYSTILYNPDKVEALDYGQVMYKNQNNVKTAKITWGQFKSKSTNKVFVVVCTHWALGEDMRLLQVPEYIAKVKEIQNKYKVPVICVGDYNSGDADGALSKFKKDMKYSESKYTAKSYGLISMGLHTGNGIVHTKGELGIKSYIDIKINQTETVDHILCPEGTVPTYYDTVVDQDALEASDHCPIYADFKF